MISIVVPFFCIWDCVPTCIQTFCIGKVPVNATLLPVKQEKVRCLWVSKPPEFMTPGLDIWKYWQPQLLDKPRTNMNPSHSSMNSELCLETPHWPPHMLSHSGNQPQNTLTLSEEDSTSSGFDPGNDHIVSLGGMQQIYLLILLENIECSLIHHFEPYIHISPHETINHWEWFWSLRFWSILHHLRATLSSLSNANIWGPQIRNVY